LPGGGTRWESLHIVQGIVEGYRITGEERYKKAAVSLWASIREYDRHPSGAFSTHESASGSIYTAGSIETCCSVAWLALSIDVLRLTGDSAVADELELTTWNQVLGAQHPSGNWCTYDNPINGVRAPSYHQIHFQYRPGTPELNCCSVNAPRGLGMLSEWAVMEDSNGIVINFYGPGRVEFERANGTKIELVQETGYPVTPAVRLTVSPENESSFDLRLRIPAWSQRTTVTINGEPATEIPKPGRYLTLKRFWKKGDLIELQFDMTPRYWVGQGPERGGYAAVFAGPLLLTFDAYFNAIETADLKPLDMKKLDLTPVPVDRTRRPGHFPPMGLWKTTTVDGQEIVLCDFGSAGAHGTDFAGWLPAVNEPPPSVALRTPEDGAKGAPGSVLFRWEAGSVPDTTFELLVARDAKFNDIVTHQKGLMKPYVVVTDKLDPEGTYYWKVQTVNSYDSSDNRGGPRTFDVSAAADPFFALGKNGLMLASELDGNAAPTFGKLSFERNLDPAPDRAGNSDSALAFTNKSKLRYKIPFFPEEDYTFTAWVCPKTLSKTSGIQQIFSAWCRGMDDPLRVTFDGDSLFARIEAKSGYTTPGVPLRNGEWVHVAAVKQGAILTLYVNGQPGPSVSVPEKIYSAATEIGIGFNPLFSGGEHFTGRIDNFALYAAALTPEQIAELDKQPAT